MSPLERCQADFFARLDGDSFFSDVSVILWRARTATDTLMLRDQWTKALAGQLAKAGKYGAAVFVESPVASIDDETPGPVFTLRPRVVVIEEPGVNAGANGTGKSAEQISMRVLQLGHKFCPGQIDDSAAVNTFTKGEIAPATTESEQALAFNVTFSAKAGVLPLVACVQPVITSASLTVTLTTATSGASLLYSTDGSYPSTPYTAPFAVSSGDLVRAVATKSGLIASPLAWKVIT